MAERGKAGADGAGGSPRRGAPIPRPGAGQTGLGSPPPSPADGSSAEKPASGRRGVGSGRAAKRKTSPGRVAAAGKAAANVAAGEGGADSRSASGRRKRLASARKLAPVAARKGRDEASGSGSSPTAEAAGRRASARAARAVSGRGPRMPSARRPAVDGPAQAAGEGGEAFRIGLPLSVKIATVTAALVAVLMVAVSLFLYHTTAGTLDRQINMKGVVAAHMLASFADPIFWFDPYDHEVAWRNQRIQRLDEWRQMLNDLVADERHDYLYISIIDHTTRSPQPLLVGAQDPAASYERSLLVRPPEARLRTLDRLGAVEISEGIHDELGRIRRFVAPVHVRPPQVGLLGGQPGPAQEPQLKGHAHVFMRAGDVDTVKADMLVKVGVATGVGIALAIVLSIGMSMALAAPLRSLVNDMRNVARGNLDHRTVPRSSDEIGVVAHQFNEMTRSLKVAQKGAEERAAIENELGIATEIQTKLLPDRIPQIAGFDLFSYYLSAKEVGGDYYDFLVIDQNHLGLVVADVSGKGIPGAMVMTMVRSLLRMASQREVSPAETLKKVNRILAKDIRRGMFVTAIYAVLDVQTKRLTVCSAGHNPLIHVSTRTGKLTQVNPSGIALGFDKGRTFDDNIKEEVLQLEPGDRLVVYTDGVVEAMSPANEEFGMERLVSLVEKAPADSSRDCTNAIVQALEKHRGKSEQSDDITIMTLRVT